MGIITAVYHELFYRPLLNGLVLLTGAVPAHDMGLAVIILTIAVKFLIFPFQHRAIVTQRKMRALEPELRSIKERFKKDSQEQARKTMELYRAHGINPLSGFVILIVQIPVFIALYKIFMGGANFDLSSLYSFVSVPADINLRFLGLVDMTRASAWLAALAGVSQFFQMKLSVPPVKKPAGGEKSFKDDLARSMSVQARYVMPAFVFFIAMKFSSAMALYWTTMNVFAIVHESVVAKKAGNIIAKKAAAGTDGEANPNDKITGGGNAGKDGGGRDR